MKKTSTQTSRKASTTRKSARVPAQVPAAADSRADIYQRITDRIAVAIEAGAGTWQMPWHPGANGAAPRLPVNAVTGKFYRGINTVVLWATAQDEGYPGAVWATYRQWTELGAQVRKGEQSSPVVFWKINGPDEGEDGGSTGGGGGAAGEDDADGRRPRVFAHGYSVFTCRPGGRTTPPTSSRGSRCCEATSGRSSRQRPKRRRRRTGCTRASPPRRQSRPRKWHRPGRRRPGLGKDGPRRANRLKINRKWNVRVLGGSPQGCPHKIAVVYRFACGPHIS